MIDVCVGEEPKPISYGTLLYFNKAFNAMFEYFSEGHERIVTVHFENHPEDPLTTFGSLTISNVRRWLKYYQLVTVEEKKEPLPNPDSFRKNRTLRIIKPTKRGFMAYENGVVIKVKHGSSYYQEEHKLGIGKPYSYWEKFESVAETIWKKQKIAMTRRGKWHPDLKDFYVSTLLDQKTKEALNKLEEWASAKAFDWNINHRKRPKIKVFAPKSDAELPKGQARLFA